MDLKNILQEADRKKVAIGHFNISDLAALKAIFQSAHDMSVPVLIGTSEGERDFIGPRQAVALVRSLREEYNFPIFINADHTHSLDKVKEAAEAGYDEILFDGSKLSFAENVKQTKQAVDIVKSINPEIIVEGEIGYIGSASEVLASLPEGASLDAKSFTTPEEAKQFIGETKIDVLAPAVGNMHGLLASMVTGDVKKHLDITRIKAIKDATNIFMTLHGGSGTADDDFIAGVKAGLTIIHVSTELRVAWRKGVEEALKKNPNEVAPYKLSADAVLNIKTIVRNRLQLFNQT